MTIALYFFGILGLAVGAGLIGFGIPINEFTVGNTLILAGTVAAVGGVVVIALAAVHGQLKRLSGLPALAAQAASGPRPAVRAAKPAEAVEPALPAPPAARPAPARPPLPTARPRPAAAPPRPLAPEPRVPAPEPAPEPRLSTAAETVDEGPLERFRAAFRADIEPAMEDAEEAPLSPRAPAKPAAPAPAASQDAGYEPKAWSSNRAAGASAPRSGSARPGPRAPERAGGGFFDSVWPARGGKAAAQDPPAELRETPRRSEAPRSESAPASGEAVPMAILKSGVVDGMAYTLYTDGSIEAELAQGVVRFSSIEELRAHLEKSA